jgi:hypothetical protein
MIMLINTLKSPDRNASAIEEELVIPKYLPPAVKDVAESLLLRDPESARRYLEIHQPQSTERRQITH